MQRKPFNAQVSSLYPIDLTACLFHSVIDASLEFNVFITDTFAYDDTDNRHFVARAALPLSSWEFAPVTGWQQHHLPLDGAATSINGSLAEVYRSFIRTAPRLSDEVARNFTTLLAGCVSASPPTGTFQRRWAAQSARLIAVIFDLVGVRCTGIRPFSRCRDGTAPGREAAAAIIDIARRLNGDQRVRLVRGGTIESASQDGWQVFNEVERSGGLLRFANSSRGFHLEMTEESLPSVSWRYRGPTELLLLRQFGLLVDLPWYSLGHQFWPSVEPDGIEVISPIHFSDAARAGGAARLAPTGYTLVEYDHPAVREYVAAVLGSRIDSDEDLADIVRFLRSPPRTDQRFTKSQGSARVYRNDLEETWRRKLLAPLDRTAGIADLETDWSLLRLGERLALMRVIVTLLKEYVSGHLNLREFSDTWSLFRSIGIIDTSGDVCKRVLLELFERDSASCRNHLRAHGRILDPSQMSVDATLELPRALSRLRDRYRILGDEYYSWLAFMMAGPLKAHILSLFLLIGSRDIRETVGRLVRSRSVPALPFRLAPWECV